MYSFWDVTVFGCGRPTIRGTRPARARLIESEQPDSEALLTLAAMATSPTTKDAGHPRDPTSLISSKAPQPMCVDGSNLLAQLGQASQLPWYPFGIEGRPR